MTAVSARHRRAFTLIELLVVIAILGILMTLLFPAVTGALENAKKAQAKNDATQIANAIVAYNTEYGRMPVSGGGDASGVQLTGSLLQVLIGEEGSGDVTNPRRITFFEAKDAKGGKNGIAGGTYMDPWGNAYQLSIDGDYDNKITSPAGGGDIRKTVIVWSGGKNGALDSGAGRNDDVKSWE